MLVLIVTGTPGTGKTTLSKKLAKKLNFYYVDVNKVIKKYSIAEGYDRKRKTKIVNIKKLNKALINEINNYKKLIQSNIKIIPIKNKFNKKITIKKINNIKKFNKIKKGIIIDSHLSHYLPKKYADLCIATKCDLKVLKKRLEKKGYSKGKVRENLDAEIFDICLNEAKENQHKVLVIDTTKGINMKSISSRIGGFIDIKQGQKH